MAKLYGTLTAERGKPQTKAASKTITASAQSWDGSIAITLDALGRVQIRIEEGSTANPARTVYEGNIADMLPAGFVLRGAGIMRGAA